MKSKRVFAILLALVVAMPLPVYADEIETSVAIEENSSAATSTDSDDDEAEDGEDSVYQNGSISTKDTSTYASVTIANIDDLRALADSCHSDAWSQDKSVTLEADIVLSGDDVALEIPTFGGIFDGNGHTISGLVVNGDEADRGLFGTIQESGLVQNLTVTGSLTPSGTQSRLGGIAGTNYGQILDCTFQGTITADAEIGGIVGRNKLSGMISGCESRGTITGNSYTGGIVGYNEGEVRSSSSRMDVNIDYTDSTISTDQLSNTISNILMNGQLNSAENIQARTDTGGIAGFSSGILYACKNTGKIGYEHVGYNTGGVVGRSSGLVNSCSNTGKVLGRKDVGGIAGQLTPDLRLDFEESTLGEISDKLDELDTMVNNTLDDTESYSNDTSDRLSRISDLTGSAKDSTKTITDNAQNRIDTEVPRINNITSTAQDALSTMSSATGDLSSYTDKITSSMNSLSKAADKIVDNMDLTDSEKARIKTLLSNINTDITEIRKALKDITDILADGMDSAAENIDRLNDDVNTIKECSTDIYENCEELKKMSAYEQFDTQTKGYVEDLMEDTKLMADTAGTIGDYITRFKDDNDPTLGPEIAQILGDWLQQDDGSYGVAEKADALADKIDEYLASGKIDTDSEEYTKLQEMRDSLRSDSENLEDVLDDLKDLSETAPGETAEDLEALSKALRQLEKYQDDLLGQSQKAGELLGDLVNHYGSLDWDGLSDSLDGLQSTLNNSPDISSKVQSALNSLASLDLHVDGISDSTRTAGDNLYSTMSSLLDEADALNSVVNDNMNSTYDDLRSITSQINDIADLFNDAVNGVTDSIDDDHIEDVSTEDIDNATRGRLTDCTNNGTVEADNNVGGVVGTMGLEYDLDPEKDIQKFGDTSFDYAYRVKCIVDRSVNNGKVEIANNYGGGIAGHMEMGVISESTDYGTIESDGNYTGGIAGYTVGTVQRCYAKADLSGSKYIGGIAGYAETLYDNAAMVNITDYEQYIGAIAGKVKELDRGEVAGNVYVSSVIYGIDGINYQGMAEGVSYDTLLAKSDLPNSFGTIELTFSVDDTFVQQIHCNYGDSIDDSEIPEVPAKEGFHGEWSRTDFSNIIADEAIEAVYTRINTLLSSEQTRESGKPVVLVSGDFAENDAMQVTADAGNTETKETWSVVVPDDGQETHEIRYLPVSEDPESVTIYVVSDGRRSRVDTSEMGKYITFEAAGSTITFIAQGVDSAARMRHYVVIGAAAAACIAVLAAGHVGVQKAKRRRSQERREQNRRRNRKNRDSIDE